MSDSENKKDLDPNPNSRPFEFKRQFPQKWHEENKVRMCAVMDCEATELPPYFQSETVFPAKIGLKEDLFRIVGEPIHPSQKKLFNIVMKSIVNSTQYSKAILDEDFRYDLDLNLVEAIDDASKATAASRLNRISLKIANQPIREKK